MPVFSMIRPSPFGEYAILWSKGEPGLLIHRIFLSDGKNTASARANTAFPGKIAGTDPFIEELAGKIDDFFKGENVTFELEHLDWARCSGFQERTLLVENGVPRGNIITYARIASRLGLPNGARAVGNALAGNPFPIIIPCHRAVRSDGSLGGFQGGLLMKRALLEQEGIPFCRTGKVDFHQVVKNLPQTDS